MLLSHYVPAQIGMHVDEVDTPSLLIELDAFEYNLEIMAKKARQAGIQVRPHAKTHKCAEIALKQIECGAIGVCCQKVGEAEFLFKGGIQNIFISNQVIGHQKLERLANLAQHMILAVAVDSIEGIDTLALALNKVGSAIDVYIEVDIGQSRCGVQVGIPVIELAMHILKYKALRFAGIHAFNGKAQHIRSVVDRKAAIQLGSDALKYTLDLLKEKGIACPIVTGAGTGTFLYEISSGVFNEIQPGSYIFMDRDYRKNEEDPIWPDFQHSLYLWATVMSTSADRVVIDAGLKAHSVDSGMPKVLANGWSYEEASDEHGVLIKNESVIDAQLLQLGDKIRLIPGHCDPTVNLHDWLVGIRNSYVESIWAVSERGAFF